MKQKIVAFLLFVSFPLQGIAQSRSLQFYRNQAEVENRLRFQHSTSECRIEKVSMDSKSYEIVSIISENQYNSIKDNPQGQRGALIMSLSKSLDDTTLKDLDYYNILLVYTYKHGILSDKISITFLPRDVIGYKLLLEANEEGSNEKQIEKYETAAKNGNIEANEILAYLYENGYRVKQNYLKSYQYYKYLSEHPNDVVDWYNHVASGWSNSTKEPYLYHLAWHLNRGLGCKKDQEKALDIFKELAKEGHEESTYYIGEYYFQHKLYGDAIVWINKGIENIRNSFMYMTSAQVTTGKAFRLLSSCYRYGLGVKSDKNIADSLMNESFKWYNTDAYSILKDCLPENNNFVSKGVNIKMVFVKGATFRMGATEEQCRGLSKIMEGVETNVEPESYCLPITNVKLDDYYIGEHEITQAEWYSIMGYNNSITKGDNYPVHNICWYEAQEFVKRLNQLTGRNYRLPTEAEWEYAARGGSASKNYMFIGGENLDEVAWTKKNSNGVQPICQKRPNELGLYDMAGNVQEWCNDWMGGYGTYGTNPVINPLGQTEENSIESTSYPFTKIMRGGSAKLYTGSLASDRHSEPPARRHPVGGLRLCESINK